MSEKIVTIGTQQSDVVLDRDGTTWRTGEHRIEVVAVRADEMEIRADGREYVVPFSIQGSTVSFAFDGAVWLADVADKGARVRARHRDHSTSAPMPGVVLRVLVQPGDRVGKGTPLLILEAMKMEHQIVAPREGTVTTVNCSEGELVQPGIDLVDVEGE